MTTGYLGKTVMKEFSNSPTLLALLDDFDQWCDTTAFQAQFLSYVWDITTAQGFGLDIWGRILGQSRYLQVQQTPGFNFGFNALTVVTAGTTFGAGDGTTTAFQLKDALGNNVTPVGTPIVYRTDWQGKQQMYTTPRTNMVGQSEVYTTGWTITRASVTQPGLQTLHGTTAFKLVEDTSAGTHLMQRASAANTFAVGDVGVVSAVVHVGERPQLRFGFSGSGAMAATTVLVDLPTGAFTTVTGTPLAFGLQPLANGWMRVYMGLAATSTGTATGQFITAHDGNSSYTGDGVSGLYVDAVQVENLGPSPAAVLPTSYIACPTTSAVTLTDYSITGGGAVTMAVAPLSGATLTWAGKYTKPGTNWQPFNVAPFYNGSSSATVAFPLQDTYYRKLLLVKAAANIASCDCPSINYLMRAMFGDRGRCYVGYDPLNPMHIGYHFEFFPTAVEKSIIESGLFPQPAGTTVEYIYETLTYAPFGFAGANAGANPKFVTGFNQGPFYQP
jgi:hypothetical protein